MFKIDKLEGFTIISIERSDIKVSFLDYGATIYDLKTKDKNGIFESIVLQ